MIYKQSLLKGLKPDPVLTVTQWADEYRYLPAASSKESGKYRTSRVPYLREIMDEISPSRHTQKVVVVKATQIGAPLWVETPIPTPTGWIKMGDLKTGDEVFDEHGVICSVLGVSKVFENRNCYEVIFSEKSKIICDAEHLWTTFDLNARKAYDYHAHDLSNFPSDWASWKSNEYSKNRYSVKDFQNIKNHRGKGWNCAQIAKVFNTTAGAIQQQWNKPVVEKSFAGAKTVSTIEIFKSLKKRDTFNHVIPLTKSIKCSKKDLPIEPWVLGYLLGDGDSTGSGRVACSPEDREFLATQFKLKGFSVTLCNDPVHFYVKGIAKIWKENNLFKNKHIPSQYLRASKEQRIALVQGLIDSDGYVDGHGSYRFSNTNKKLIDGFAQLVRSLGLIAYKVDRGIRKRSILTSYEVTVPSNIEMALLPRKKNKARHVWKKEQNSLKIIDVKKVKSVPVKCISVDSPNNLFLCGKSMIPTHNTEAANNFLMCIAHLFPGPCLIAFPTDAIARKHSKKKLTPSINMMPCLKGIIKEVKSRDSGNTILEKDFPGGSWTLTGSNSPTSARHDSIRYLVLDDYDGFVPDIGGEGDPASLFSKRTDSFGSKRKIFINSTPTIAGISVIEKEFKASSQGLYHVPCPHCGEYQALEWGGKGYGFGIKFTHDEDNQIKNIWYVCKHCKKRIKESDKEKMLANGKYIHKYPNRLIRGFKINSLYSPLGWVSWSQIAKEFLDIDKSKEKLKVFVNTRLAETFEEIGDQPEWPALKARAEPYDMLTMPEGGMLLTAGVDVQDDRLVVIVRAWGRHEESWLVYYGELWGDPDKPEAWAQLDKLLLMNISDYHIISCAVDTGGHRTQAVYNYCRFRAPQVIAIKGASQPGKPVIGRPTRQDVTWNGEKISNGVELWPVGSDVGKSTIYSRLRQAEPGAKTYHWPIGLPDEYYLQLTAERQITKYVNGYPKLEWIKVRERNDVLDCFDGKTEVLTKQGWKFFKDLLKDDNIATINLESNYIEYQKPLGLIKKHYKGKMVWFKTKRLDILVTPTHRMIVKKVLSVNGKKTWDSDPEVLQAKDVKNYMALKMRGRWKGDYKKLHHLKKALNGTIVNAKNIIKTKYKTFTTYININKKRYTKTFTSFEKATEYKKEILQIRAKNEDKTIKIDACDYAELLGWFVSEGHTFVGRSKTQGNVRYVFVVSQNPGEKSDRIAKLLDRLPWKWRLDLNKKFTITSKTLVEDVIKNCGKGVKNKKVPQWIKNASPVVIARFVDAAIAGDGWTDNSGHRTYSTISLSLANDMQELFLKLGKWGIIKKREINGLSIGIIRGRKVFSKNPQYHISEIRTKRAYLLKHDRKESAILEKEHDGMVYCATVPNGTLICRRNGKSFMAGNCENYAYSAAIRAGMALYDWDKIDVMRRPLAVADNKKQSVIRKPVRSSWMS